MTTPPWEHRVRELAGQISHDVLLEAHRHLLDAMTASLVAYAQHLYAVLQQREGAVEEEVVVEAASEPAPPLPLPEPTSCLLADWRRWALRVAWAMARGNRHAAARLLGISVKCAYNWGVEFDIDRYDLRDFLVPDGIAPWADIERRVIARALERAKGKKIPAARLLGMNPKTVYRKLREYGLWPPQNREASSEARAAHSRLSDIEAGKITPDPEERRLVAAMALAEGKLSRAARYLGKSESVVHELLRRYGYSVPGQGQVVDWPKWAYKPLARWKP